MNFDPTNNVSWQFGHRGRVAVFIDGNNLFHAARFHNIDIDYNKLLRVLLGDGRLLRAFFYTGVDGNAERQQGFLLWMRRNGFRVVQKELKTFYDGTRKANLDVEIAVDMLSLAGCYDTAVLVSGDEDFVYAVNAVAYKGCRVEVAGFRSNTAPKLIDVADFFIDLGDIADRVRKDVHGQRYYEGMQPSYIPPTESEPIMPIQEPLSNNGFRSTPAEILIPETFGKTLIEIKGNQALIETNGNQNGNAANQTIETLETNSELVRVTDE